jgi:hypothetical protein
LELVDVADQGGEPQDPVLATLQDRRASPVAARLWVVRRGRYPDHPIASVIAITRLELCPPGTMSPIMSFIGISLSFSCPFHSPVPFIRMSLSFVCPFHSYVVKVHLRDVYAWVRNPHVLRIPTGAVDISRSHRGGFVLTTLAHHRLGLYRLARGAGGQRGRLSFREKQ